MTRSTNIRRRSIPEPLDRGDAYEAVAGHYYDAVLHPTCAAFRAASVDLLRTLAAAPLPEGTIVELGAGRASVPETIQAWRDRPTVFVDASPRMLAHSGEWLGHGATGVIADARRTGLADSGAALIVAALADPYNDPALWREVRRLLRPGGRAIMTTPSCAWASQFRPNGQHAALDAAEFAGPDGRHHAMPSYIFSAERQAAIMAAAGLRVIGRLGRSVAAVPAAALAPKLGGLAPSTPFVEAYVCEPA